MMRGTCGMLMAVALLAAACSDGDGEVAPTTTTPSTVVVATAPVATTPPPTESPTTVASMPPTTPATPTSAPATPTPPTSAQSSTEPLDLAAQLQRDATAAENTLFDVLANPSDPNGEERLRRYMADRALASALATLEEFRRNDYTVIAHPVVPVTLLITGAPTPIEGAEPPRVSVETCRLDSAVVMAPLVGSDARVPINDVVYRTDAISTFILIDGIWRIEGGETLSQSEGDTTCD